MPRSISKKPAAAKKAAKKATPAPKSDARTKAVMQKAPSPKKVKKTLAVAFEFTQEFKFGLVALTKKIPYVKSVKVRDYHTKMTALEPREGLRISVVIDIPGLPMLQRDKCITRTPEDTHLSYTQRALNAVAVEVKEIQAKHKDRLEAALVESLANVKGEPVEVPPATIRAKRIPMEDEITELEQSFRETTADTPETVMGKCDILKEAAGIREEVIMPELPPSGSAGWPIKVRATVDSTAPLTDEEGVELSIIEEALYPHLDDPTYAMSRDEVVSQELAALANDLKVFTESFQARMDAIAARFAPSTSIAAFFQQS